MKSGPPDMLLEVSGLVSHYGRIEALKGIDLAVAEGELLALVGGNGAGKTTLLRAISGVRPASAGRIRFAGTDISVLPAAARVRLGISQVAGGPPGLRADERGGQSRAWRPYAQPYGAGRGDRARLRDVSRSWPSAAGRRPARCRAASSRCWRSRGR